MGSLTHPRLLLRRPPPPHPKPVPATPRARLSLEQDLPLIRWTLPQSKRTSLLTDTKVHAYLLHCFQWAATPTAVKCHMTVQHPEWKSGPKQSICSGVFADTSLCPAGIVNKCILILTATGLNVLSLVPVLFWKSIIAMANADMDVDAQEALFFGQSPSKPGPTDGRGLQGSGERRKEERQTQGQEQRRTEAGDQAGARNVSSCSNVGIQRWLPVRTGCTMGARRHDSGIQALGDPLGLQKLTQHVLRQEQTLASLRQDMVMHLFMKNGETGTVPGLCDTAAKWRTTKEEEPES